MKIAVAQTKPSPGDLTANLSNHLAVVQLAAEHQVSLLVFPELSLTGYEPSLAQKLAILEEDPRLVPFQTLANLHELSIAIGAPLKSARGIHIGLIIFQPHEVQISYAKRALFEDENAYFVPGTRTVLLNTQGEVISPAICYELSVPWHREEAIKNGASIYMTSVAKTTADLQRTDQVLSTMAKTEQILVMMANCIGPADVYDCCGNSAIWNREGTIVGRMDSDTTGLLIYDTKTFDTLKIALN